MNVSIKDYINVLCDYIDSLPLDELIEALNELLEEIGSEDV